MSYSFQANNYAVTSTVSDDEPLATPPGTTDMGLKIKQVCSLSLMLQACLPEGTGGEDYLTPVTPVTSS